MEWIPTYGRDGAGLGGMPSRYSRAGAFSVSRRVTYSARPHELVVEPSPVTASLLADVSRSLLRQIAEAASPSPRSLSSMRLVSTSWRDAVRYARVAVRPGGADCFAPGTCPEEFEGCGDGRGGVGPFLNRATCVDLNGRHVSWVLSSKDVRLVAPFLSTWTESLVLDNVQRPDVIAELLDIKSAELQNLRHLSLQKSSISDDDLVYAIKALPGLHTLDVSGCMFLRGDFLEALSGLKELEALRLGGCGLHMASYHDEWEVIMRHAGASGRLKELVLLGNVVGDAEVRCLAHVKDMLRYLDLRRCSDVTFEGVYFIARELRGLETLKLGPVFGVDARRGLDEVWKVLRRGGTRRLVNLEVFGMEDGGSDEDAEEDAEGEVDDQCAIALERGLRMVSFMDTNVCWRRLRALQHIEYLNVSRSLPVSVASTGNEFFGAALSYSVIGFHFPRLKTLKASNSLLPWQVLRAVMEGAEGLANLDLGGWEGLRASRLTNASTKIKMMEGFSNALCGLTRLETLRLPGTHLADGHVRAFLAGVPSSTLRVLDLSLNSKLALADLMLDQWPLGALEVLNISNTGVKVRASPELRDPLPLRELLVSGRNVDGDGDVIQHFIDFIRLAPMLTVLHMTDVTCLSNSTLAEILEDPARSSRLQDLSIAGCCSLTPSGLKPLSRLTKLTKLDISRLRQAVTDDNLAAVLRRNTLSELRASGTDLTSASMEAMLNSKLLHYADVSFCFGMGDDEQCGQLVTQSGSPIKIRLPRGSARLGLFSEGVGTGEGTQQGREGGAGQGGAGRAGRRLNF